MRRKQRGSAYLLLALLEILDLLLLASELLSQLLDLLLLLLTAKTQEKK